MDSATPLDNMTLRAMYNENNTNHAFVESLNVPSLTETQSLRISKEIADCAAVNLESISDRHEKFLHVVRTGGWDDVTFELEEALRGGASVQKLEQMLRHRDIDCWLIAMPSNYNTGSGQQVAMRVAKGKYVLCLVMNQQILLKETFFKDAGSYTANFNKLSNTEQLPCDCHPRKAD
jgi:hypothetical protein